MAGGAGFIGRNFLENLLQDPNSKYSKILVIDKLTYASSTDSGDKIWNQKNVEFIEEDLLNLGDYTSEIKNFDFAVNFAAESHVDNSILHKNIFVKNNIEGAVSFFDACYSSNIPKIVQISTDEVYGSLDEGEAKIDSALLPNSPYSASKAAADLLARSFNETYGKRIIITRCTNNYGKFQHPEKFIPRSICSLLMGGKIQIYGRGENVREWIHVQDHVAGILKVLNRGKQGCIYNFGSGIRMRNLDLAKQICKIMGAGEGAIEFVTDRLGHDNRYAVDSTNSRIELGFEPRQDFDSSLGELIDWYRSNSNWWLSRVGNLSA